MNKVILLLGPTASGKTGLSIEIAKRCKNVEVVNFDSVLFYKHLNIGSAKPTPEEMDGVKHHLIDIAEVSEDLNASDFVDLASEKINELLSKGITPILVGGSAFYLRSLIRGMYDSRTTSDEIRQEAQELLEKSGIETIVNYLKEHDPESVENLHINDHYRLTRAYEYFRMTGEKISDQKKKTDDEGAYDFSQNIHNWDTMNICLDLPKEEHWQIIERRTKEMLQTGLITEVEEILSTLNGNSDYKSLKTIGYKEVIQYIKGELKSIEELEERIFFATRRLAKSQKTFLKKITPLKRYHPLEQREIAINDVIEFLEDRG